MRPRSIRTTLTLYVSTFFILLLIVAVSAIVGVRTVNKSAQGINRRWIAGSQILGDMNKQVSEFRIAETYRALALEPEYATKAERLTTSHGAAINDLFKRYKRLVGPGFAADEISAFSDAWTHYATEHQAWIARDPDLKEDSPASSGSSLHEDYEAADQAVQNLIHCNTSAADAQATEAEWFARRATALVSCLAILAGALTLALIWQIQANVSDPLRTITAALSQLASGSLDVRVPQLHRQDEIGEMAAAFDVFRMNAVSLTEARELADSLARHDALTGLPNRRLFASELDAVMADVAEGRATHAVMLLDLDHFKAVNDLQGHAAGDLVLCEVARRLRKVVGQLRTVARLGGDEFALIVETPHDETLRADALMHLATRILHTIAEPVVSGRYRAEVGVSIGIAMVPAERIDADAILHTADLAMYRAKKQGRNTIRFFEPSMDEEVKNRAELEAALQLALRNEDVKPFYQPLVDIATGRIRGFEVLSRWDHPTRGSIPPDTFIPIAEQLGVASKLTALILRQACRDSRGWDKDIHLAVNVSPMEFQDHLLPSRILSIIASEDFPPSRLEIEVTETALVGDMTAAKNTLEALQASGIRVVLDDFGSGYSSLYHLRELKFDTLKIDRSFVGSMQRNDMSEKIVDCVLKLAHSLDMKVVAEGIEDEETARLLMLKGCEFGQGFFYSKAVPASEATLMLAGPSTRRHFHLAA